VSLPESLAFGPKNDMISVAEGGGRGGAQTPWPPSSSAYAIDSAKIVAGYPLRRLLFTTSLAVSLYAACGQALRVATKKDLCFCDFFCLATRSSIMLSISQSINQSIYQSIDQSTILRKRTSTFAVGTEVVGFHHPGR